MPNASPLPVLRRCGQATHLIVDGEPFLMLSGELHNSSGSSLAYVEPLFAKLAAMHLNTIIVPLYWELVEPQEGVYDFSLVDGLIELARAYEVRLLLLWFATLKNAESCYAPAWVKKDLNRFPRAQGANGERLRAISVFGPEIAQADARAFAATMRRIHTIDSNERTVIMVQVQNETGILRSPRDFSPPAEAAFQEHVPSGLLDHLQAQRHNLIPEFEAIWAAGSYATSGSWSDIFGDGADEVFMAWHIARFVEAVTAAGRAEYDLPMFANAWLIHGPGYRPGDYPSGGPVSKMLDVWRAAAPHIELLAPDIYQPDFRACCASYHRHGNALLIPEARKEPVAAANALYAFGRHAALCFGPFGIEDIDAAHPLVETYRVLDEMMPLITAAQAEGRITAFLQQADEESWEVPLGRFIVQARTRRPVAQCTVPGSALLIALDDERFLVAGRDLILTFRPNDPALALTDILSLECGDMQHGEWVPGRRLNGDETYHNTGVLLGEELTLCRFQLYSI